MVVSFLSSGKDSLPEEELKLKVKQGDLEPESPTAIGLKPIKKTKDSTSPVIPEMVADESPTILTQSKETVVKTKTGTLFS